METVDNYFFKKKIKHIFNYKGIHTKFIFVKIHEVVLYSCSSIEFIIFTVKLIRTYIRMINHL